MTEKFIPKNKKFPILPATSHWFHLKSVVWQIPKEIEDLMSKVGSPP